MKIHISELTNVYSIWFDNIERSIHICINLKLERSDTKIGYVDTMHGTNHILYNKTKPFKFFTI